VVLTYALAPYGLWATLKFLQVLHLVPKSGVPVDAFWLLALVFGCYAIAVSLVLGATAVAPERERRTRDQIRITALTGREQAAGFFWGRLGPVLASLVTTTTLWCLLRPDYSRRLGTFMPQWVSAVDLAVGSVVTLGVCALSGEIGLLASTRAARTSVAVVSALVWFILALAIPLIAGVVWAVSPPSAVGVLGFVLFYASLFVWEGIVGGLEQR
jgi:hypothetical protein